MTGDPVTKGEKYVRSLPWKEQSQLPMEKPCSGHTTAGQRAGRQADGPLPPGSIPGDVRNIRRLPCPPPALQPSHRNAQLGFPHPDAIKKFRMWLGEEG